MDVGVVSRSFPQLSNEEVAALLAERGFRWTELCFSQTDSNYWRYNGRTDLSDLTDKRSQEIVETYRKHGIEVASIGVFTNLLETDEQEMEANLQYFERHMQIAAGTGVPIVATECGFIPGKRGIQADSYEKDFERLKQQISWLGERAGHYGIKLALEPCVLDVVPSAKRTADFLAQVGSPHVQVLLDPANLIANSSEEEMFQYLAPHLAYFHGKDRKVNDTYGRCVGDGDIDWRKLLNLYHEHAEGVPFILEYVNIHNFCEIRDRVIAFDQAR
jgi:sugar phosphate isomerase/epimerase